MYRAVTRKIEVTVTPRFVSERSSPSNGYFFWAYTINITNLGARNRSAQNAALAHYRCARALAGGQGPWRRRRGALAQAGGILRVHQRRSVADAIGFHGRQLRHGDAKWVSISTSRSPRFRSTLRTPNALSTRFGPDLTRRELIIRAAEFAGDGNLAVFDHVVAIILRKAFEHRLDIVARARAFRVQRAAAEDAHAWLVEKPVNQPFAGKRRDRSARHPPRWKSELALLTRHRLPRRCAARHLRAHRRDGDRQRAHVRAPSAKTAT